MPQTAMQTSHSNAHVPAKMRSKALTLGCHEILMLTQL